MKMDEGEEIFIHSFTGNLNFALAKIANKWKF